MKIDTTKFAFYDPDESLVQAVVDNGLDGAECMDLFKSDTKLYELADFLHYYFPMTDEEKAAYYEYVDVKDSRIVHQSHRVQRSEYIVRSKDVTDSTNVYDSINVDNCRYVYSSKLISRSCDIINCHDVDWSDFVFHSDEIDHCNNIYRCTIVEWSNNLFECKNVFNSFFSYYLSNCTGCGFVGFSKNTSNCMFSTGLDGAKWMIFNEPVDPAQYMRYEEVLHDRLETEVTHIFDFVDTQVTRAYQINHRPDCIFEGLSEDFYGWVSKLPGYTDEKFLELFFTTKS